MGETVNAEINDDISSVVNTAAQNIGGQGSDDKGDTSGDEGSENTEGSEQESQQSSVADGTENQETDANANTQQNTDGKPQDKPAAGTEVSNIDRAIKSLEKLKGKELKDEEVLEELAKSHMTADKKIEGQKSQIKNLVSMVETWEQWYANNRVEEIIKAYKDPRVQNFIEQIANGESVDMGEGQGSLFEENQNSSNKAVLSLEKKILELSKKLDGMAQEKQKNQAEEKISRFQATLQDYTKKAPDFKVVYDEYIQNLSENKYAQVPEILQRWGKLVNDGIDPDVAWNSLNPDRVKNNITSNIAKDQKSKTERNSIMKKTSPAPQVKRLEDADSVPELVKLADENVKRANIS